MIMLSFAVGDIHGCFEKLQSLLRLCAEKAGGEAHRVVFLGDYVDRGPDSRRVVDLLMSLGSNSIVDYVFLKGNHEAMLINALDDRDKVAAWYANGGEQTLASYHAHDVYQIPSDHLVWLRSRPLNFDDGLRFFVHAGVHPWRQLHKQRPRDMLCIRDRFLKSKRTFARLIVHGHTPCADGVPEVLANRVNVDTGAVFGGPLTAAIFGDHDRDPTGFVQAS
jgi:serine/threonine protein phosphatase 1